MDNNGTELPNETQFTEDGADADDNSLLKSFSLT